MLRYSGGDWTRYGRGDWRRTPTTASSSENSAYSSECAVKAGASTRRGKGVGSPSWRHPSATPPQLSPEVPCRVQVRMGRPLHSGAFVATRAHPFCRLHRLQAELKCVCLAVMSLDPTAPDAIAGPCAGRPRFRPSTSPSTADSPQAAAKSTRPRSTDRCTDPHPQLSLRTTVKCPDGTSTWGSGA